MNTDEELFLFPLHRYPEYIEDCLEILNDEWPRSKGQRLRAVTGSCDDLPTCLALVRKNNNKVIGHAKLSILPRDLTAVFIESVVISRELRGIGYGRILMNKVEEYSNVCGYCTAYLATHDKQEFYKKLGYQICPPVITLGGCINKNLLPKQICVLTYSYLSSENACKKNESKSHTQTVFSASVNDPLSIIPVPPLPPITNCQKNYANINYNLKRVFMKKCLL